MRIVIEWRRSAAIVALLAALLTGCGDGGDDGPTPGPETEAPG